MCLKGLLIVVTALASNLVALKHDNAVLVTGVALSGEDESIWPEIRCKSQSSRLHVLYRRDHDQ